MSAIGEMKMSNKGLSTFLIGALVGAATITLVKTPAFRKGAAKIVSAGMQLKNEASAFAASVKEDAEDIVAEANYNNSKEKSEEA